MKNQRVKFTAADESMTISLSKSKSGIKITARHRSPSEGNKLGCKQYFDLPDESKAEAAFAAMLKDATTRGWTRATKTSSAPAFTELPFAPGTVPVLKTAKR